MARDKRPNHLLYDEALRWACEHGYQFADFAGCSRDFAEAVTAGGGLSDAMKRSRDYFNLGFGAHAVLLPKALIWFRNPLMRWAYPLVARWAGH